MQHRRGGRNCEAVNEDLRKSNDPEYSSTEDSDSSDGYEEETHISYEFRRWANHIWSVSNNVTSRLRGLLRNNPNSSASSNHNEEENFLDESDATTCTTSSGVIESWAQINNGGSNKHRYRQHPKNHRDTPRENHSRYGRKFSPVTEDGRLRHVAVNSPAFIVGHNVATHPPVLILRDTTRVHHGVNQQSMRTGFYQSRRQMSRCHNAHGDQYADGWCQQYHMGKQWGYEGSRRAGCNNSAPSERRGISEKLSASVHEPKIKGFCRKPTEIGPGHCDFRSEKHFSTRIRDFRSDNYRKRDESVTPVCAPRHSRKESFPGSWRQKNYGDVDAPRANNNPKKVAWGLQLSDITSREPSSTNLSRADQSAKSYITSNTEEKSKFVENVEIPVKDNEKRQEVAVPPNQDINAVEGLKVSHDIQPQQSCNFDFSVNKHSEEQIDDLANGNSVKWSSNNGVDSLLRDRMETLSNVHLLDTAATSSSIECNRKEKASLTKTKCIVASCLARNYRPHCLKNRDNEAAIDTLARNEEGRPSFSERIQDIWQKGRPEAWKSSPDHETLSSGYNLNSGENVPSGLSLLGLDQQSVLRGYFGEHNSTVTLARILEKLIDSKTKMDLPSQRIIGETPKPPPRSSRKQSNTRLRVNVGVQKTISTSTTASQEPATCSRHRSMEKRRSRRSSRRTFESCAPDLTSCSETSRPLHVFSVQSIIPISSSQFVAPIPNLPGFSPPPQDTRPLSNYYDDPLGREGDFIIVDDPLVEESNHAPKRGPCSSTGGSSFGVKGECQPSNEEEFSRRLVNEEERILSYVLEKIERERHSVNSIAQETDTSQQHALHYTRPVRLQESKVADDRVYSVPEGVSAKSRSWWQKKCHFNKSGSLKEKMSCFLKYVAKKHTGVDCQTQKYYYEKTMTETIVPRPPIRVKRKSTQSTKSIQWDLDTSMSQCTETIDLVHVIENAKLNKSTSAAPIIEKVTVASGTNTDRKKPRETISKLFPTQKNEVSVGPEIIQDSKETCTDSLIELPAICDRNLVESSVTVDAEEEFALLPIDNKPSFSDLSLSTNEDLKPSTDPGHNEGKDSIKERKFEVSRSFSSKIPLATSRAVSPFNASSRICRKRPSTAPILDNPPSSSLPSNESLGVSKAGRECSSHDTPKKMLFKHNRSSLLRANHCMSRKYAMGQSNIWINTTGNKHMERKSIFKNLTSPVRIDDEKPLPDLSSVEETPCEKIASVKGLEVDESDSLPEISGRKIKQTDSKHWSNGEANNFLEDGADVCGNLEHSKDEEPSRKADTASLDVKPCSSHASEEEEKPTMNTETRKLGDNEGIISSSMHLLEEKGSWKTCPRLPYGENANSDKDEKLPVQVNDGAGERTHGLADSEESRGLPNKIPLNDANVSGLQFERESILTEHSLFQEKSEGAFSFRVRVDRMKTTFIQRNVELQPKPVHSPARKTEKYLLKHHDSRAKQLVLQEKEMPTFEKSKRPRLQTKSIPSVRLPPQDDIGKSIINSSMLWRKEIVPLGTTVVEFNPANNESNAGLSESSDSIYHTQDPIVEASESEELDVVSIDEIAETAEQMSTSAKNSEEESTKMNKARSKKTGVILGTVCKSLDVAIDRAVNVNRETNSEVSSKQTMRQSVSRNSEKSSDLSTDSLEPIQAWNMSNYSDDKLKVAKMLPKVTVENSKEMTAARLLEMGHYMAQSIVTFDLTEVVDKPEKLLPSMFNGCLDSSVKIAKSKRVDSCEDKSKHEKLSSTESNSIVLDDENNWESRKGDRNVKIDNKVLVEKVKSSIEDGVPLKTITITNPAILKHSNMIADYKKLPADKMFKESRSEARDTPSKRLCYASRSALPDATSDGECSYTTWASHDYPEIDIGDRTVPETPSEDRNNSVPSTPSLKLNKKPTRPRGSLIPRYQKCPYTRQ